MYSLDYADKLKRRFVFEIAQTSIQEKVRKKLKEIASTVRIDGFRAGKAPFALVSQKFGDSVRLEIQTEEIQTAVKQLFEELSLKPVATPQVEIQAPGAAGELIFSVEFEIYPALQLDNLAEVQVKTFHADVPPEWIEKEILELRQLYPVYHPVERGAQNADKVVLTVIEDEENAADDNTDEISLVLGQGMHAQSFEEKIVGAKAGEKLQFSAQELGLSNAQTLKEVAVKSVEEPVMAELDALFFEMVGAPDVEHLRTKIQNYFEQRRNSQKRILTRILLFRALLEHFPFDLPLTLIASEKAMLERDNDTELDDDRLLKSAERRVAVSLVVGHFINNGAVEFSAEKVKDFLKDMSFELNLDPDELLNIFQRLNKGNAIMAWAIEQQVADYLLTQVTVNEELIPYEAFLQMVKDEKTI